MPEVFPIPKATRPWKCRFDNPTCLRNAKCPRCRGYAARMKGQRKQREARKKFNVPVGHYWGEMAHEEAWRAWARIEVKAGQQVKAIATKYMACENQAPAILGDLRPFVFIAMPDGWGSEGLAVVRLSVLAGLVELARHGSEPQQEEDPSSG